MAKCFECTYRCGNIDDAGETQPIEYTVLSETPCPQAFTPPHRTDSAAHGCRLVAQKEVECTTSGERFTCAVAGAAGAGAAVLALASNPAGWAVAVAMGAGAALGWFWP